MGDQDVATFLLIFPAQKIEYSSIGPQQMQNIPGREFAKAKFLLISKCGNQESKILIYFVFFFAKYIKEE